MKVLTIRQPWATLIIQQSKRFEFRSWKTNYRGEIFIHAGQTVDKEAMERLKKYLPEVIPTGKILGKVKLIDCIKTTPNFRDELKKENKDIYKQSIFKEEYAWQVELIEKFDNPINVKGKLGLWNYEYKI